MAHENQSRPPRVALEQWRVLHAVVEAGGYAQAAKRLHKSQSSVTYAVQKLERLLGVRAFEIRGRKAELTEAGRLLYRRAAALLKEAAALEGAATRLAAGWEPEIRLAVDTGFPTWLLLNCLERFTREHPAIRIDVLETSLGGTEEALVRRQADFGIGPFIVPGFPSDPLLQMHFVAVAAPNHPLHALNRPVTYRDLRHHRQLVISDSGSERSRDAGWLGAESRLTVTYKATSIRAACQGLGFAWYPREMIREELASGALKPLNLAEGAERHHELYLIIPDPDLAGPGTKRLIELLRESVRTDEGHLADQVQ